MNIFQKLKQQSWFSLALAGCTVAVFYLIFAHLGIIAGGIKTILGFFEAVFISIILAYLMNSPANFFQNTVFAKVKNEKKRWNLSVVLTVITVLIFLLVSMMILIPQLVQSIAIFLTNLPTYAETLHTSLEQLGLSNTAIGKLFSIEAMQESSDQLIDTAVSYVMSNFTSIVNKSASAGKVLFNFIIAFVMSIYFMMSKMSTKAGLQRFLRTLQKQSTFDGAMQYFSRCDLILSRYVVYNIIDAIIIGGVNAVFMLVCGIPYIGLISFVVGITNLIPTFGPVIGAVIAAFILLMVSPGKIILFLIFTVVLQFCDGYVIKPKLFGDSLGVSGLLIIVGVIVGGNIAGIGGILLATPVVAILDFTWRELLLPRLETRRARMDAALAAEAPAVPDAAPSADNDTGKPEV